MGNGEGYRDSLIFGFKARLSRNYVKIYAYFCCNSRMRCAICLMGFV